MQLDLEDGSWIHNVLSVGAATAAGAIVGLCAGPTALGVLALSAGANVACNYFAGRIRAKGPLPNTQQNHDLERCLRAMVLKRLGMMGLESRSLGDHWPRDGKRPDLFPSSLTENGGLWIAHSLACLGHARIASQTSSLPDVPFGTSDEWIAFLAPVVQGFAASHAEEFATRGLWWFLFELRHDPQACQALTQYVGAVGLSLLDELRTEQQSMTAAQREMLSILELSMREVSSRLDRIEAKLDATLAMSRGVRSVMDEIAKSGDPDPARVFKTGATWADVDVTAGCVIDRTISTAILDTIRQHQSGLTVIRIGGASGNGKTTLLMRIAAILSQLDRNENVFFCYSHADLKIPAFMNSGAVLFVDNCSQVETLEDQLESIRTAADVNLVLVLAEHDAVWAIEGDSLVVHHRLSTLDDQEIIRLDSLLVRSGAPGWRDLPFESRISILKGPGELMVAINQAWAGSRINETVAQELRILEIAYRMSPIDRNWLRDAIIYIAYFGSTDHEVHAADLERFNPEFDLHVFRAATAGIVLEREHGSFSIRHRLYSIAILKAWKRHRIQVLVKASKVTRIPYVRIPETDIEKELAASYLTSLFSVRCVRRESDAARELSDAVRDWRRSPERPFSVLAFVDSGAAYEIFHNAVRLGCNLEEMLPRVRIDATGSNLKAEFHKLIAQAGLHGRGGHPIVVEVTRILECDATGSFRFPWFLQLMDEGVTPWDQRTIRLSSLVLVFLVSPFENPRHRNWSASIESAVMEGRAFQHSKGLDFLSRVRFQFE